MSDIDSQVRKAFRLGREQDTKGSHSILCDLVSKHGIDAVKEKMAEVDPQRLLWHSPVRPGETGLHGYPLVQSRYDMCSDRYGHLVDVAPQHHDDAFITAVREGFENGTLHDTGNVVLDRETNRLAFLVSLRLEDDTIVPDAVLQELSARHGVALRAMAWPNSPQSDGSHLAGYACIVAPLERVEQFMLAQAIADDVAEAERVLQAGAGLRARP